MTEDLGTVHGYYNKCYRSKYIHVNSKLDDVER